MYKLKNCCNQTLWVESAVVAQCNTPSSMVLFPIVFSIRVLFPFTVSHHSLSLSSSKPPPAWLDCFIFHRLPFFIHPRRPRLLSHAGDCSSYASVMVPYAYYANIPGHEIKDIATNIHTGAHLVPRVVLRIGCAQLLLARSLSFSGAAS